MALKLINTYFEKCDVEVDTVQKSATLKLITTVQKSATLKLIPTVQKSATLKVILYEKNDYDNTIEVEK